jgi:hypothetical protein
MEPNAGRSPEEIEEKVRRKGYLSAGQVLDVHRIIFIVDRPEKADDAVERIRAGQPLVDRRWIMTRTGYFHRTLMVTGASGTVREVQIVEESIVDLRKQTMQLYLSGRRPETSVENQWYVGGNALPAIYERALVRLRTDTAWAPVLEAIEQWRAEPPSAGKPWAYADWDGRPALIHFGRAFAILRPGGIWHEVDWYDVFTTAEALPGATFLQRFGTLDPPDLTKPIAALPTARSAP